MAVISLRAYARHRGVSLAAVQKAIKSGRIPAAEGGVDPVVADALWSKNTSVAQNTLPTVAAAPTRGAQPPDPGGPVGVEYNKARAVREGYRARREKIEYERQVAAVVSVEEVRLEWTSILTNVRDALLALPLKVSGHMAAMTDQREIERYLRGVIRTELTKISKSFNEPTDSQAA